MKTANKVSNQFPSAQSWRSLTKSHHMGNESGKRKRHGSSFPDGARSQKRRYDAFVIVKQYKAIDAIIQVAFEHTHLSPKDMSAVWSQLSHLITSRNHTQSRSQDPRQLGEQLGALIFRTIGGLREYGPIQLCQTALGMAKIIKAVQTSGRSGRGMSYYDLFHRVLLGRGMERKESIFQAIASAAVPILPQFEPQGHSNLAYACAIATVVPTFRGSTLFEHLADAIGANEHLTSFQPQSLSNIVWAYATAKVSKLHLYDKVAYEIIEHRDLESFKPQNLANIVWAFATTKVSDQCLFQKVAREVIARHLGTFAPQALANIIWAFATAKVSDHHLLEKIAKEVISRQLRSFNPQDLANIVWAFATAKVSGQCLFEKVAGEMRVRQLGAFKPQALANIVWACAASGLVDCPLFRVIAPRSVELLENFNCLDLANIAWSFAVADVEAPMLFNANFTKALLEKGDSFSDADLSKLHQWHLWQKEERSNDGLPLALRKRCHDAFTSRDPNISSLQNQVTTVLRSLDLEPKEEVLTKSGYSLDAVVEVNGKMIGIEVDGPSHFIGRKPTGSTMLKRRQIAKVEGMLLVSIPYWEWNELGQDRSKKQNYLRCLLQM